VKLSPAPIAGLFVVETDKLADARGFFLRSYCAEEFRKAGAGMGAIVQTSLSFSAAPATLRGLHWQSEPHGETKLVRALRGRIFDVAVDLRAGSPTHLKWFSQELDGDSHKALLIPPGCAHGFVTLTPDCLVEYTMDAPFMPDAARGARWDDPAFAIAWPLTPQVISERDLGWPLFA
jgi:dTDP-4-dehydrorhamnose 3,5-epimerase